jgi:NADPH-dependent 2,4-dienoyl-CoA reductase/sulfur reductase-like enzyme/nitrite reductase/ring-hydroxylating ferredoxin subunit
MKAELADKETPMSTEATGAEVPDFSRGIAAELLAEGAMLAGRVGEKPALLARRAGEVFAVGSVCTHYGAPLAEGLLVGDTVRCPWHHACFSLRTGEALRAPALDPVPCWKAEEVDGVIRVHTSPEPIAPNPAPSRPDLPESVVIVGGGAAGGACAEMLRREGYLGRLVMLSADAFGPCDRPNLSKGFLAGTAPADSNLLRAPDDYHAQNIELKLGVEVAAIDTAARQVELADGGRYPFDALLLATGAEPVRLDIPGAHLPHVHYLRTLADSVALVGEARPGRRAVVIGASFIGLEVAASLRARGVQVHVVAPEKIPMQRVLGSELGEAIRKLHEDHGVIFHLGTTVAAIDGSSARLATGEDLAADFVVIGVGVRPALGLAERAGLTIDRGVKVDAYLETSAPGIFAAGDIARWPDRLTGDAIRVEHWVVAERQGQTAARNILGQRERFDCVPFFWTEQYDFSLAYIGHAEHWDQAKVDGSIDARDCTVTYRLSGKALARAEIHRDLDGLRAELEFEQSMTASA